MLVGSRFFHFLFILIRPLILEAIAKNFKVGDLV
jgi:hypothetical protein